MTIFLVSFFELYSYTVHITNYYIYVSRYRCIDDRSLCDRFFDCPGQEDENPEQCLFYKTVSFQICIEFNIYYFKEIQDATWLIVYHLLYLF